MVNAVKVFKKTSPNGKVTAYLTRRDFVDHLTHTAPVDGVVVVDEDYLNGRKVFASVAITYRYGREEDEVMGLHFSKEYELVKAEVLPMVEDGSLSKYQSRLIEKLGDRARPFSVTLPDKAPTSVSLEPAENEMENPLGVMYDLKFYIALDEEEKPHKRSSVSLAVRKVQYAPSIHDGLLPYTVVSRTFTFFPGKLSLEVGLNHDIYFYGQPVETLVKINNASKKTVKSIKAQVVQHVEITMTNTHFSRIVAAIDSCEGCPITPEANYEWSVVLTPLATNIRRFGIALDGKVKDHDANLASSTITAIDQRADGDILGIIVSYSLRVKLLCGFLSGELAAEVPFKLMHPDPESNQEKLEEKFEFEDFKSLRRGKSIDEELDED